MPLTHTLARSEVLALYRAMLRIRRFEETLGQLVAQGRIGGTTHLCAGQEAVPVGVSQHLTPADLVVSTHRGHGHLLAKGGDPFRMFAEFAGKQAGYCEGKGGSQHTAVPALGHMGSNGITGGGLPIGAGLALAQQMLGTGRCVVAYLGDGAATTGNFHETMNVAALWRLPLVFVLENNGYAMSTPVERAAACASFVEWAERYRGMVAAKVDGNDVVLVAEAVAPLLERARRGEGPALLECTTYRHFGHSKSDPCAYRTRAEEQSWRARDPLLVLAERGALTAEERDLAEAEIGAEIAAAAERALQAEPGDEAVALAHIDLPTIPGEHPHNKVRGTLSLTEALRETLAEEMERDARVVLIGEDLGVYGGAFGVTRGLVQKFGAQRVRETPICENTLVGLATGAAVGGLRPVVELMFGDFVTCCMDALVNHAAKLRYMYAGQVQVPLTLRMPIGRRNGYGATHSQSLEGWFLHVPGLAVVCPATVADAVGLLRTAIRTDAPVIFLEPKLLYPVRGPVPAGDYVVPLGKARLDRVGRDLTLFTYGQALPLCQQAADELAAQGHSLEIIDLRSLAPLDLETCVASLHKTGRGLCVQEACEIGGVADVLLAALQQRAFGVLHAPLEKVACRMVPVPASPALEAIVMPSVGRVVAAAHRLLTEY